MRCGRCGAPEQNEFPAEISIHFPKPLNDPAKLPVLVFPKLLVCFQCGRAEFAVPEAELSLIVKGSGVAEPHEEQASHTQRV